MILKASFPSSSWNIKVILMHTHEGLRLYNMPIRENGQKVLYRKLKNDCSVSHLCRHLFLKKRYSKGIEKTCPQLTLKLHNFLFSKGKRPRAIIILRS